MLALVVIAGCTDGRSADTFEQTAEPAVTTAPPTTTTTEGTLPPTTTTTTTEPPPPWTLVEFPPWPDSVLAEELGGPLAIATMCVDLDLVGFDEDSSAARGLRTLLSYLGIDAVEEGCDATLEIDAEASRSSARYRERDGGVVRTCWGGERADGAVTLSVGGQVLSDWPIDVNEPPPDEMRGCPGEDSPVVSWYWTRTTLVALIDTLGPAPGIANDLQLAWGDEPNARYQALRGSEQFIVVLGAGLGHPATEVRESAARKVMNWADSLADEPPPYPETLWSTIPYLIACPDFTHYECDGARNALRQIFFRSRWEDDIPEGFDIKSQADWWALWEANPMPPEE
jgi:hypothetical protein